MRDFLAIIEKLIENVYIILPVCDYSTNDVYRINETKSLIYSADAECVGYKIVKVREITPSTYIGKGKIEEFLKRADELGISIKLTDDASKIRVVGNSVCGEVSTKGALETKRRRVYGTTNGYQLLELLWRNNDYSSYGQRI